LAKRIDKDSQYLVILGRLFEKKFIISREFEPPKGKPEYLDPKSAYEYDKGRFLPHSSAFDRIAELQRTLQIHGVPSGIKSKKQLDMLKYTLTFHGYVRFLQLSERLSLSRLLAGVRRFLPELNNYVKSMRSLYTDKEIIDIFLQTASNTIIGITHYKSSNADIDTVDNKSPRNKKRYYYKHSIKIPQISFIYELRKNSTLTYETSLTNDEVKSLFQSIRFAFGNAIIHESLIRQIREKPEFEEDVDTANVRETSRLRNFLREEKDLGNNYREFLHLLRHQQNSESFAIQDLMSIFNK
jgi:hypothetical protein